MSLDAKSCKMIQKQYGRQDDSSKRFKMFQKYKIANCSQRLRDLFYNSFKVGYGPINDCHVCCKALVGEPEANTIPYGSCANTICIYYPHRC